MVVSEPLHPRPCWPQSARLIHEETPFINHMNAPETGVTWGSINIVFQCVIILIDPMMMGTIRVT